MASQNRVGKKCLKDKGLENKPGTGYPKGAIPDKKQVPLDNLCLVRAGVGSSVSLGLKG